MVAVASLPEIPQETWNPLTKNIIRTFTGRHVILISGPMI
jgi:hypothetical protein